MIIRPDNIAISVDIVNNIKGDLISIDNKDTYLNNLIQQRLQKCSLRYLDNIDNKIDKVINSIDNLSINDIMKTINIVSKKYSDLYRSQISLYKTLHDIS